MIVAGLMEFTVDDEFPEVATVNTVELCDTLVSEEPPSEISSTLTGKTSEYNLLLSPNHTSKELYCCSRRMRMRMHLDSCP